MSMGAYPTVGIITRTKDRPVLLRRAIESVVNQTYGNWAMVIVNDGGAPDEVESLAARYATARGRIRLVHNERSLGMEGASKVGLDASEGDLLIAHDDDDSWAPEFLTVAVHELLRIQKRFPQTQGVATYSHRVLETVAGNSIHIESVEAFNGWVPAGFVSLDRMLAGNFIPPISFLFTRRAYERVGGVYESIPYLGDWEFLIKVLAAYDVYMIPQYLAFYHWRTGSAPGGLNNTVTAEIDRHLFYRQFLLNKWLREDLAAGKTGIGTYANFRNHIETMSSRLVAHGCDLTDLRNRLVAQGSDLADLRNRLVAQGSDLADLRNRMPHASSQVADSVPPRVAQAIVDYYWDSLSWRALRLFRSVVNRVMRLPPEKRPSVRSADEAWRIAREVQESLSWNIAAPLRWVESLVGSVRRARHAKSGEASD
jgi:glycosyltransferase involved in cell wall biosynthesis